MHCIWPGCAHAATDANIVLCEEHGKRSKEFSARNGFRFLPVAATDRRRYWTWRLEEVSAIHDLVFRYGASPSIAVRFVEANISVSAARSELEKLAAAGELNE